MIKYKFRMIRPFDILIVDKVQVPSDKTMGVVSPVLSAGLNDKNMIYVTHGLRACLK